MRVAAIQFATAVVFQGHHYGHTMFIDVSCEQVHFPLWPTVTEADATVHNCMTHQCSLQSSVKLKTRTSGLKLCTVCVPTPETELSVETRRSRSPLRRNGERIRVHYDRVVHRAWQTPFNV
ncbi:hypothetical protein BaRGS_00011417 [Batillaria attramentaria]|uniref:Secreted protein n=1 Tax=Batillaria attramentaria TaxID=370345 RepID=A0ABD0LDR2_9CAEN